MRTTRTLPNNGRVYDRRAISLPLPGLGHSGDAQRVVGKRNIHVKDVELPTSASAPPPPRTTFLFAIQCRFKGNSDEGRRAIIGTLFPLVLRRLLPLPGPHKEDKRCQQERARCKVSRSLPSPTAS